MSRCHVRCRKCKTRRVLAKHPDEYLRLPPCTGCGAKSYCADKWMNTRNTRKASCSCAGYHFPHRIGSPFCWYRSDGSDRLPGDADFKDPRMKGLYL